jgi:hypothetical protein
VACSGVDLKRSKWELDYGRRNMKNVKYRYCDRVRQEVEGGFEDNLRHARTCDHCNEKEREEAELYWDSILSASPSRVPGAPAIGALGTVDVVPQHD